MYANDVVLLASAPEDMKEIIRKTEIFFKKFKLNLNLSKSMIVIFKKGGKLSKKDTFQWDGQLIDIVNEYKYLGFIFSSRNSYSKQKQYLVKKAQIALRTIWGICKRGMIKNLKKSNQAV